MLCRMEISKKNKNLLLPFIALFIGVLISAQPAPNGTKVDGVAAVVGDEIILTSDIQRDYELSKQRYGEDIDLCAFVDNTLLQKMILFHAKSDTLIEISNERIKQQAQRVVEDFRSRGSDEEVMRMYGVRTMPELQKEIEILVKESQLVQEKQKRIENDIDASPEEVREFYAKHENELPKVQEEVELSHIVMFPILTEKHKQEIIDKLKGIKKEIEEGASFETKAILYSEDEGSKDKGGLYENIKRGTFVPEFDAVAFNLQEGEISDPVETEFGFHIIQLEKRLGQAINVRHILIKSTPNESEIKTAMDEMEVLKTRIENGEITFKEAALKYSSDKYTKYNGGVMVNPQTGEDKFERSNLSTKRIYAIAGLDAGAITKPYEIDFERKPAIEMLQLNEVIPAHKITLDTDYTRLKNLTELEKKQDVLYDWLKMHLNETFITISDDYSHCDFEVNWLKK